LTQEHPLFLASESDAAPAHDGLTSCEPVSSVIEMQPSSSLPVSVPPVFSLPVFVHDSLHEKRACALQELPLSCERFPCVQPVFAHEQSASAVAAYATFVLVFFVLEAWL
jgi:hypothetical protein